MRRSSVVLFAIILLLVSPALAQGAGGQPTGEGTDILGLDWMSLAGSGLVSLPDTSTLPRGRVNFALSLDNQDRDPLKMDVLEMKAAWTAGLGPGLETYGHAVVARAITVSPRSELFPSPITLVLPDGHPVPQRPYYPIYSAFPYINRRGHSQLDRFRLYEAVVGAKKRLLTPLGMRPGVALSAELKLPLTRALPDLEAGAGTGGIDERLRLTFEWQGAQRSLVGAVAYTHLANGAFGDRLIVFRPSGEAQVDDQRLLLPSNLVFGAGVREVLSPRVALVAELTKLTEVGGRTRAFRVPGPVDFTFGAQLRLGRLRATLCARYHANSIHHREQAWPLAGLADLTDVEEGALAAYLEAIGAASALPHVRRRSHIAVAIPESGPPLPPGARILPPGFTMGPHSEAAYVVSLSWTFGGANGR